jgi:4-amino-4-deoxy-L-arabinose transferase-like glycosyltransferase
VHLKRWLVVSTGIVVALTRIWARSRTLWDWDETLFALGVRSYDVTQHHPHPPGFPLFVVAAKFVRLFVQSDFRALQAINVIAAIALFPLLLWLALELRFPFRTAYLGALLFVFLPNVWFYGGTAFSDIPALALTIAACACLLRGCESRRAYFAGALLLGLAAAIRPQALVIGLVPALSSSWCRKRPKDVVVASAMGIAILGIAYCGAAFASSSVRGYVNAMHAHALYMHDVDSFNNPNRPPLSRLFADYFLRGIPGGRASLIISALALSSVILSFVRKESSVWLLMGTFLPFEIFAWYMLDMYGIPRFATTWAPMYALLAVNAIDTIVRLLATSHRDAVLGQSVGVAALIVQIAMWTLPSLREVRRTASPPVAAMQWIAANVPNANPLYVEAGLLPFAQVLRPGANIITVADDLAKLPAVPTTHDWFIRARGTPVTCGVNFSRHEGRLLRIQSHANYETSITPLTGFARFAAGWYGAENEGAHETRWMGRLSQTFLPALGGTAKLMLSFELPMELVDRHVAIDLIFNGEEIEHFAPTSTSVTKEVAVVSRADGWNELVISTDKTLNPANEHITSESRDLGLMLTGYTWQSSSQSSAQKGACD